MEIKGERNGVTNAVGVARDGIVGAMGGTGDMAGAMADTVSHVVVQTLRGNNAAGYELLSLGAWTVTGVVQGVAEVGTTAGDAARSIMIGVLRGTATVGRATVETVRTSAAALVRATDEAGGNVVVAARGAIEGAIEAARDLGLSTDEAAHAAASGALKAAGAIGSTTSDEVRRMLAGAIAGVEGLSEPPFRPQHR